MLQMPHFTPDRDHILMEHLHAILVELEQLTAMGDDDNWNVFRRHCMRRYLEAAERVAAPYDREQRDGQLRL